MSEANWHDLGSVDALAQQPLAQIVVGRTRIALSCVNGVFGAVSGVCNHHAGPLGDGELAGEYITCPWHYYKFHRVTGEGEPGFEADRVPRYTLEVRGSHLWIDLASATRRHKAGHPPSPLERPLERAPGPIRVAGISTTVMDREHPRYSTSDDLLQTALAHAAQELGCESRLLKLNELSFRNCEGFYSKSAHACTWPCSITEMDPKDQMEQVYEALVFWADVVLVATPIRWGNASSLYYKMAERLNCVQNQIPTQGRVLLRNKTAAFVITGGQDNVQAVAGQMLGFFAELGFHFPQFPYIAHSRGWTAEDMERNVAFVKGSVALHEGARGLADRAVTMAKTLLAAGTGAAETVRAGRKACPPEPTDAAARAEQS